MRKEIEELSDVLNTISNIVPIEPSNYYLKISADGNLMQMFVTDEEMRQIELEADVQHLIRKIKSKHCK